MDGNNLRLDLWSFLILISLPQEKYSLMTKARFELRKAITSVLGKKLKYLLVSKCCHGKVPFQRYHNDKTKYFRSFHKVYSKHNHLCSRCLVSPRNALSPPLRDLIKQGLWRLLKTLFNGKENSLSLVKLKKIALLHKNQGRISSYETEKSKQMENRTRKAAKHVIKNSKSHTDGNTFIAVLQPSWSKQWGKQSSRKKMATKPSLRNRLDVPNVSTKNGLDQIGKYYGYFMCLNLVSSGRN